MGLEDLISLFDQPLANLTHLFRSAHSISFDSEYLMSKYRRGSSIISTNSAIHTDNNKFLARMSG
jgi:hypothetical protein